MKSVFASVGLALILALAGLGALELRNRMLLGEAGRPLIAKLHLDASYAAVQMKRIAPPAED